MLIAVVAEELVELPRLVFSVGTGFNEDAVELIGSVVDLVGTLNAELCVTCAKGIVLRTSPEVGAVLEVAPNVVSGFSLDRKICDQELLLLLLLLLVRPEMRSPLVLGLTVGMLMAVLSSVWVEEITFY
jgi:hypothetical protein